MPGNPLMRSIILALSSRTFWFIAGQFVLSWKAFKSTSSLALFKTEIHLKRKQNKIFNLKKFNTLSQTLFFYLCVNQKKRERLYVLLAFEMLKVSNYLFTNGSYFKIVEHFYCPDNGKYSSKSLLFHVLNILTLKVVCSVICNYSNSQLYIHFENILKTFDRHFRFKGI